MLRLDEAFRCIQHFQALTSSNLLLHHTSVYAIICVCMCFQTHSHFRQEPVISVGNTLTLSVIYESVIPLGKLSALIRLESVSHAPRQRPRQLFCIYHETSLLARSLARTSNKTTCSTKHDLSLYSKARLFLLFFLFVFLCFQAGFMKPRVLFLKRLCIQEFVVLCSPSPPLACSSILHSDLRPVLHRLYYIHYTLIYKLYL